MLFEAATTLLSSDQPPSGVQHGAMTLSKRREAGGGEVGQAHIGCGKDIGQDGECGEM